MSGSLFCAAVITIDTSGLISLEEVLKITKKRGVQLAFANPGSHVIQKFELSGLLEKLGSEWIFLTVAEAVQVCSVVLNKEHAEASV